MTDQGYLRHPALRGDTIVFVCDDDLWSVSAGGGTARRLTAGLGEEATPCFSPDGKWLAFVSRDEQHPEVYLMPAEGGPARRMTWLGPDVMVRGFTREGHILFVTTHGQPFFRNYRAYTLDPAGGMPQMLPLGQVNHLSFGPGKAMVIGRNTADPARWKRYRGGTAGHLWVDADGSGQFRRMTELAGNITSPMWIGERIYFLSDSEGVGNLYSVKPDGSDQRRHTDHDDYYARHAQTDGKRIVYQCGAQVWLFDPATDTAKQVPIRVPAHRTQAARKFVSAADHLGGFDVHPAGHSLAVDVRGKLFTFGLWEGAVRQLGMVDGARHRHGQWLGDGTTVVAVSDETGEERVQTWKDGTTQSLPWDIGRVITMRAAPRGNRVAIGNHRNEVLIGDLDTGEVTVIDRSDFGRTEDLGWSPDGAWLAYQSWTDGRHCAIKLYSVTGKSATLVTQPEFLDYAPAFDPDGKYLYFLSIRTFDPVYDAVQFELSFPRAARPYLIALQANSAPPFEPPLKGLRPDDPRFNGARDEKKGEPAPLRVDLDGIERRVAAFPVPENKFGQIAGVSGSKVVWTIMPIVGAHGRGGHKEGGGRLELFDFDTLRPETLSEKVERFAVAQDRMTIIVRDGKKLRAIPAYRRHEPPDPAAQSDAPSRKSGWIDLSRIRAAVEPRAEWRQMLREIWRLQRDQFWTPNMSGIDWNGAYEKYAPLLDRVSSRGELSDLIWEMQGELGTSHAYEMGGDHRKPPQWPLGQLGADWKLAGDGEGYEITRIVAGDPWDSAADSPLSAIGVEAKVGERIVAVNGQPVSRTVPPQALLVHQANTKVELTIEGENGRRTVVATTLADEVPARYREWVERNREWVHAQTNGRVGYFHLPDMQSAGYAEFHRYFSAECDRDALIIDLRYNRGGHVSQLLLEKIARKRQGYRLGRWMKPFPYPEEAVFGPVVALTNEHAGSDGDIFSHNFKLMGLGPLVGTRTWGGVVGIWPRHSLVDGTETTQPEFSFWFNDVGFGVENYGTDPQIEVDNAPQDAREGRDRQLETALATALDLVEKTKPGVPEFGKRPVLARGPLPARNR
jgi:tricorn protease